MRTTKRAALAALVLAVYLTTTPAAGGAVDLTDVDGPEDFTLLAGDGYSYGVPGDPVDGYTTLPGTPDNTYNWTGLHFDPDGPGGDPGMLLMGTLQNTFDFSQSFATRRAQIWRYDIPDLPDGDPDLLQGDWTLAWESDLLLENVLPVPECVGLRGAIQTNIDGVERAVFSCTGAQAKLIGTTDGETWTDASRSGFGVLSGYIGFRDIVALDWNADGTDDALMVSPVGVAEANGVIRTDYSPDDRMFVNTSPFSGYSRWRQASENGFGNPDNFVNFATTAIDTDGDGHDEAAAVVASNRVSGAELYVTTDTCPTSFFAELFGTACDMEWELVFDEGVGKPLVNVADDDEPTDFRNPNAYGSDFTQVGETIYVTLGETAFQGNDQAADETEIIAIHPPGSADCPTGADCSDWVVEVLMGDPREGTAAGLESSIRNFHCTEITTSEGTWCVPTSYVTASFGEMGDPDDPDLDWGALDEGAPFYTWRATTDGTYAYFTTAGSSAGGGGGFGGFELWRLDPAGGVSSATTPAPGGELVNIFRNLGEGNLGGRTLFYAEPLGLVIGTATTGDGTDVFVGGCYDGPPIADPGDPQVFFDRSQDDVVSYAPGDDDGDPAYDGYAEYREQRFGPPVYVGELKVDGSASRGAPCDDVTELTWFEGHGCVGGNEIPDASWTSVHDEGYGIWDPGSWATDGDGSDDGIRVYELSLAVTSGHGLDCTDHSVTASSNLPPVADVTGFEVVAPDTFVCDAALSNCAVVDMDENGTASLLVTAECTDPENDAVTSCEWSSDYTVTDISPDPVLFEGSRTYAQTPAGETVSVELDASSFSITQCSGVTENESACYFATDLDLGAVDQNGFADDTSIDITLAPPTIDVQIEVDSGGSDECDVIDAPGPDLPVPGAIDESPVCIWPQAEPTAGVPVEVWVQVENDGTVPADVTVTLDVGGNGDVTYLDDPAPAPFELAPFGVEIWTRFTWTPQTPGPVTLTAEITSSGTPADNDPDDNVQSRGFTVAEAAPPALDAAVTAITTADPADEGVAQDVTVTVENTGTGPWGASATVELYEGATLVHTFPALADPGAGNDATTSAFSWTPGTAGGVELSAVVTVAGDLDPANDESSVTVTVNPDVDTIHLAGLSPTLGSGLFFRTTSATATVLGEGGPKAGATVSFTFTRGILPTASTSCVTNASGTCTATGTVWFAASSTWTVTDITAPDSVYVPGNDTAPNPVTVPQP